MSEEDAATAAPGPANAVLGSDSLGEVAKAAAKLPTVLRAVAELLDTDDGATILSAVPDEYVDALDPDLVVATLLYAAQLARYLGYTAETVREQARLASDEAVKAAIAST